MFRVARTRKPVLLNHPPLNHRPHFPAYPHLTTIVTPQTVLREMLVTVSPHNQVFGDHFICVPAFHELWVRVTHNHEADLDWSVNLPQRIGSTCVYRWFARNRITCHSCWANRDTQKSTQPCGKTPRKPRILKFPCNNEMALPFEGKRNGVSFSCFWTGCYDAEDTIWGWGILPCLVVWCQDGCLVDGVLRTLWVFKEV
jgi:hypothetical protein